MSQAPIYTEYHPRWYRVRTSTWWWLRRRSYLVFILREMSSVFIAWFVVFTLLEVSAVKQGGDAYLRFRVFALHPLVVALNVVSLFFVVFHAITWFNLAPKAMVIRLRGQRVPPLGIVIGNLAAWALVSALLAWLILRGEMAKKSIEPLLWTLFSGGGVLAALFLPIHIVLFGVLIPLGLAADPGEEHLLGLLRHPLARIYLLVLCMLALFHAAHRFRFTLYDGLQIKHLNEVISVLCYGGAIAGSLWAGYLLWQVP